MDRDINKYDLIKIIAEFIRYQQDEIDTYKIIITILLIIIRVLFYQVLQ